MSEKKRILEAIRMRMRRDGMTYAMLAKKLSVSEVSVKRYFSEERLTLDTLDGICKALGATLDELIAELKSVAGLQKDSFTAEQESTLARDEFLFLLFFLVARGYSFDEITQRVAEKSHAVVIKALRDLEKIGLIHYPSNKELRSLVGFRAQIRPGGPLWKKYSHVGIKEYFDSDFAEENEHFKLSFGYLSEEQTKQLKKKFELFEDEIRTMLALEQVTGRKAGNTKFYWIANSFRPMQTTILETIAKKSKIV